MQANTNTALVDRKSAARLKVVQLLRDFIAGLAREQRLGLQHGRLKLLKAEKARDRLKLAEQPLPHTQVFRQEVACA